MAKSILPSISLCKFISIPFLNLGIHNLPSSIHKLQVKSLISITEVSGNELKNLKNNQPKEEAKVKNEIEVPLESTKKRNKKETESK